MGLHSALTPTEGIHAAQAFEHASIAAMLGQVVDSDDLGKISRVLDVKELWALVDSGAQIWKRITEPTTARVVNVYLDTIGGNDAFSGMNQSAPIATMARAAETAPRDAIVVFWFLTAGNYAFTDLPFRPKRWWWVAATGTRVSVATGTCGAGTTDNHIVASGLTVNAYRGCTLEMTSGAANTFRRTISENGTTFIYPCRRFENYEQTVTYIPATGDSYSVYRPGVVITGLRELRDRHLCLRDIEFEAPPSNSERVRFVDCTVYGNGVVFRGAGTDSLGPVFVNGETSFGAWDCRTLILAGISGTGSVANQTYAAAAWYADVGLASDNEMLARERGCGMSQLDITTVSTFAANLTIHGGGFYAWGVWGAVSANACRLGIGGYCLGRLTVSRSIGQLMGRWPNNSTGTGASVTFEGRGITVYGGTLGWNNGEFRLTAISGAPGIRAHNSIVVIAATAAQALTFDSASSQSPVLVATNSWFFAVGTLTSTSVLDNQFSSHDWGAYTLRNCMLWTSGATFDVTQSGSAAGVCCSGSYGLDQGTWNITAALAAIYRDGACATYSGGITCAGRVEIEKGSTVVLDANMTVSGGATNQITVKGSLIQRAGVLTATATAGHGLVCDGGDVTLLGGASTLITGVGASKVGALTYGDGKIRYLAQPTGVSGTAGDIQCGTASPVADTALSVEGTSVADGSGANRQIMAAYAA
jgi:hypothetical protein